MSRVLKHSAGIFFQGLHAPLSCRAVDHPRLAEPAAADAAPLDLKDNPVLGRLDIRNDRLRRIRRIRYVHDQLLAHFRRRTRIIGCKCGDRSVFVVCRIIKLRDIESFDPGGLPEKFFP